ncbi:hypothetical protein ABRZ04_13715 [Castellaniella ginsengisoli]|uniref:Capsule polysaccharide biosynthesis protein n=1 Tax=Castellaniella ginsengisoli TaxID=546114 RepID=A0AB39FLV6_9BURK
MKIALFMSGSFAQLMRHFSGFMPGVVLTAICPNWQSYQVCKKESGFYRVDYIFTDFNSLFDSGNYLDFVNRHNEINIYEVLSVDKTHYKKMSGNYQLRYISAVGERLEDLFLSDKPDYIFFPIIETIEAMLAYKLAIAFGIRPIVYCNSRFSSLSFFSESFQETLPCYTDLCESNDQDLAWSRLFLKEYRENPKPFNIMSVDFPGTDCMDFGKKGNVILKFIRNLWLRRGVERHNKLISHWISIQIYLQRIALPIRGFIFYINERWFIRPGGQPSGKFDFFPLHFSPESSINVPAPYYIDQLRVVDKILLERSDGNHPLIIKEHPAMFGFREKGFYKKLIRRPLVEFVRKELPSVDLIKRASTVYSVTGTACLEAFFLGVKWKQYGVNFLSDWFVRNAEKLKGGDADVEQFICDVRSVSKEFVLYSPGISVMRDKLLFSRKNISRICEHLKFHVAMDSKFRSLSEGK